MGEPGPVYFRSGVLLVAQVQVTRTAAAIGVHRVTVHKWMRDYGIRPQITYEPIVA